jgi:Conjugative transposon protein TcpC
VLTWRERLRRDAGAGEVWLRYGLRALLVLALLAVLALGLRDIVRPFLGGAAQRGQGVATATFPQAAAQTFAARFALAYLTFDGGHPDQRRQALDQYLAAGVSSSAGWDGQGRQTAILALPSDVAVSDGAHAVVTVAVLVDGGRWVYLAVPVEADGAALAVAASPALVPAPARADAAAPADVVDQDPTLSAQLRPYLTAFLRAYAQSGQDELAYYAAPGVAFAGLGGQVTLAGIDSLAVQQASGGERSAVASVRWSDPVSGGGLTQDYRLRLVEASGKWLVEEVSPAG